MARLTHNQTAAVEALRSLLDKTGATAATASQWKAACPDGVTLTAKSLVESGVVKEISIAALASGSLTRAYHL